MNSFGKEDTAVAYLSCDKAKRNGSMVKRLRHRPFTAVTRVRFPLESLDPKGFADLQLSWLEQPAHNRSVLGSSPRRSIFLQNYSFIWPSGSVGQSAALSRRRSRVRVPSGSSDVGRLFNVKWGLSSAGRASALQAEGHRFEPYRPHFYSKGLQISLQSFFFGYGKNYILSCIYKNTYFTTIFLTCILVKDILESRYWM